MPSLITEMMDEEIYDDPDLRAEYENLEGINDELSQNEIDIINQPTMELPDIVLATLQETPVTVLLGEISNHDETASQFAELVCMDGTRSSHPQYAKMTLP